MLMRYLAAFSMLMASTAVLADALDINLNNNTAQFQYGTGTATGTEGKTDLHAGLLYTNSNSVLVNAGILVINSQDNAPGLSIGAGVEGLLATIKEDNSPTRSNASAVAIDLLARYSPPTASQIGFAGELHYAPRIITFGDAIRYSQVGVRMEYELSTQTLVYIGYRKITFGIKNSPDAVLDDGMHIGIKLGF
jgi:hypothetical protein